MTLIECALGHYPFKFENATSEGIFWHVYQKINNEKEIPRLPETCSPDFQDFVSVCLRKEGGTRASATELLRHPFIIKHEKVDPKHLKRWIRTLN
jgi:serine/threonine protein kinase